MAGLLDMIPPEYRLYAGTMLPWNKTGTVDESYFNQDFKDQIKDQVMSKINKGMDRIESPSKQGTVRKGTIYPGDYITKKYPFGYSSPQVGEGRSTPTGYSSVFNTLGTYDYKYNMPNAPDFSNASIDITDRYDWNPNYGTYEDFTGYIGQGFGREDDEDYVKGTDVDLKMLKEYVFNQIKNKKLNVGAGLELLGNYLGPKSSEGKGKDIKINIPVNVGGKTGSGDKGTHSTQGRDRGRARGRGETGQIAGGHHFNRGGLIDFYRYGGFVG